MTRVPRTARIAFAIALCALVVAPSAGGQAGGERIEPADLYWLGPYFAGLEWTGLTEPSLPTDRTFSYGDCEPPEGEGGCSLPVQVQNWTSCERNPVGLDSVPYEVYRVRGGGIAAGYESTSVDVGTGRQTVTVFTNEPELVGAVVREVRPRSHSAPQPLAPPIYPMPVLRELKRVTVAAKRFDGAGAISRAIGLHPAEVRVRLRIAELLGPDALAGVPPPTMSIATLERFRQLAFRTQFNPVRAARQRGESVAALRAKLRRVRGLTGLC
jgi:hypothetical protein